MPTVINIDHRLVFQSSPTPMWIFDRDTLAFLEVNDFAVRHYGYSRSEFLSMTINDIRDPEDVAELLEKVGTEFVVRSTRRHRRRDGTFIDVEITGYDVTFRGRPARFVWANDITAYKRAEQELRNYAMRERILADVSRLLAQVTTDYESALEATVKRVAEGLGAGCVLRLISDEERMLLTTWFHHIDPEIKRMIAECVNTEPQPVGNGVIGNIIRTNKPLLVPSVSQDHVLSIIRQPPHLPHRVLLGISSLVITPLHVQNRVIGTLGIFQTRAGSPYSAHDELFLQNLGDQAALTIANSRLLKTLIDQMAEHEKSKKARARLAALLEATPDFVFIATSRGRRVLYLNHSGRAMLGLGPEESLRDVRLRSYLKPGTLRVRFENEALPTAMKNGRWCGDIILVNRWGRETLVSLVLAAHFDSDGTVQFLSGIGRDVTQQKRVEEQFRLAPQIEAICTVAGGSETILLVEHDETERQLTRTILESRGYRVLEASTAEDAFMICVEGRRTIDLLITDVIVQQMTGRQLADSLTPHCSNLKVLYTSEYTEDAIFDYAVLDEGVPLIKKPLSPEDLLRKIRHVLGSA